MLYYKNRIYFIITLSDGSFFAYFYIGFILYTKKRELSALFFTFHSLSHNISMPDTTLTNKSVQILKVVLIASPDSIFFT